MGILDRYLERRGFVRNPVTKSAGFMALETSTYPDHRPDAEKIVDYETFTRAFRTLPWIFAGATALAIAATKPALRVYREVKDAKGEVSQEEVVGEDINALIEAPNPQLSYQELIQISVVNLWMVGNQYWNLVGTGEGQPIAPSNQPVEIWWVKPHQINPKTDDKGLVRSYEFTGASGQIKSLDPSEIIHFRTANPASYFLGMGVMEPLTKTATLELNAMTYIDNFMKNDGTPPFVFKHPGSPDKKQRQEFYAGWDERHKGPKRAGRAGMIWGGMDVQKLGDTVKDSQYPELRKMNREEMLACLGVPPSVVGLLEYANYSNMEVQQKKFWEDAVMPILGLVADKLTLKLAPLFDERYWFEFDYSKIKVLQEDEERKARVDRIRLGCGRVTPNQLRQEVGQEPYEGGDQYYIDMSLVPIGGDATAAKTGAGKSLDKPKRSFWRDSDDRAKSYWVAFEKRVSAKERALAPDIEKYLGRQAGEVRAKIGKHHHLADVRIGQIFDVETEVKIYAKAFEPRYVNAFTKAKKAGNHAAQGKLYLLDDNEQDAKESGITPQQLAALQVQIAKGAQHFNETTWDILKDDLLQAESESWTVAQTAQKIGDHLDALAPFESRRIARTEMARTENWGGLEGYKETGMVDAKGWMCSFVPASRDAHMDADGQEIGIEEDFTVGGEMLAYPGDPRGSAGNIINCLCTTYPVVMD